MAVRYCSATDVGRKRSANQDALLADSALKLFVVADGMGGHEGGDIASRLIVDGLRDFVKDTEDDDEKTWPFGFNLELSYAANRLQAAILVANRRLSDHLATAALPRGMGATLAAVMLGEDRGVVANVGDCRAYLLSGGVMRQLTRDHSWVADQVESGFLTADTARAHPWRHMVTRAIQGDPDLIVDTIEIDIGTGGRLLLCSDGLTVVLTDDHISEILRSAGDDVDGVCRTLIDAANARGAPDNVSVIVVDWLPAETPAM